MLPGLLGFLSGLMALFKGGALEVPIRMKTEGLAGGRTVFVSLSNSRVFIQGSMR